MKRKLTKNEILTLLKAEKPYLIKTFGVVDIGLFGSFARDEINAESDIDLIVDLKEPKYDWLAGLQIYLEKKFDRKIDILRKGSILNTNFVQRVEKEIIYA